MREAKNQCRGTLKHVNFNGETTICSVTKRLSDQSRALELSFSLAVELEPSVLALRVVVGTGGGVSAGAVVVTRIAFPSRPMKTCNVSLAFALSSVIDLGEQALYCI